MKLIFALKEGVAANLVSTVEVEEKHAKINSSSSEDTKGKAPTLSQTHVAFSLMTQAMHVMLFAISYPPLLEPPHIEVEYRSFMHDWMQCIQNF